MKREITPHNPPKKIFFLTAARSEYDLIFSTLKAIQTTPGLKGEVIATGSHLSPFHGFSLREIQQDGFKIAGTLETLLSSETLSARALTFANLVSGLTRLLTGNTNKKPDLLFVTGDREEALAGATVGCFLNIPVVHLHGGDRVHGSNLDETLRAAISKLSHLHFTATEGHRQRLIKMGELAERIWTVGAPGLDRLAGSADMEDDEIKDEFGLTPKTPFFMILHHPSRALNTQDTKDEIKNVLKGVLDLGYPVFCGYPNFDPGNMAIRKIIDRFQNQYSNLITYHNLPRRQFISLYRRCTAIVGNSSSIVLEAAFLRRPGVLVGPRQDLRERGPNILRVDARSDAIKEACLRCLNDRNFLKSVKSFPGIYGDGFSGVKIARILGTLNIPDNLVFKVMPY